MFSLVTFQLHDAERDRLGVMQGEIVVDLSEDMAARGIESMRDALGQWDDVVVAARGALESDDRERLPLANIRLQAPLPEPRTFLASIGTFRDLAPNSDLTEPFVVLKAPGCVRAPGSAVPIDARATKVDWESELVVVIGAQTRNVPPAEALSHVAGYTITNDVTARGLSARESKNPATSRDFFASHSREGYGPLGPGIVPAQFIPDPQTLRIQTWVNGTQYMDSNTEQMRFSVAELNSYCSEVLTLGPGDIIAVGSPGGIGAQTGTFLAPGDRVRIEIEGVGVLEHTMAGA